ncbi:hypothetical protein [Actinoalloteichus hymeniacidonis]|uniref:Syndecan 1 n=1 Tax=Actinoalloteichus hymeniacidonis TaxID=340345 RepID=A0AAC9HRZ3_9PSEU|nr:hypothetical protein [Actinoalloteichus hymeniacidonis]AOS64298.1 hypothetical protein TL08_17490 [Actinoalloteichus hymeniacidonis]MBB5907634.1 syndecan 1 [Actinoalloteichus hymeniacidonis]
MAWWGRLLRRQPDSSDGDPDAARTGGLRGLLAGRAARHEAASDPDRRAADTGVTASSEAEPSTPGRTGEAWDGGWRALPALQPVLQRSAAGISDGMRFRAGLAAWQRPGRLSADLGHLVDRRAPGGLIGGLLRPVTPQAGGAAGPPLPLRVIGSDSDAPPQTAPSGASPSGSTAAVAPGSVPRSTSAPAVLQRSSRVDAPVSGSGSGGAPSGAVSDPAARGADIPLPADSASGHSSVPAVRARPVGSPLTTARVERPIRRLPVISRAVNPAEPVGGAAAHTSTSGSMTGASAGLDPADPPGSTESGSESHTAMLSGDPTSLGGSEGARLGLGAPLPSLPETVQRMPLAAPPTPPPAVTPQASGSSPTPAAPRRSRPIPQPSPSPQASQPPAPTAGRTRTGLGAPLRDLPPTATASPAGPRISGPTAGPSSTPIQLSSATPASGAQPADPSVVTHRPAPDARTAEAGPSPSSGGPSSTTAPTRASASTETAPEDGPIDTAARSTAPSGASPIAPVIADSPPIQRSAASAGTPNDPGGHRPDTASTDPSLPVVTDAGSASETGSAVAGPTPVVNPAVAAGPATRPARGERSVAVQRSSLPSVASRPAHDPEPWLSGPGTPSGSHVSGTVGVLATRPLRPALQRPVGSDAAATEATGPAGPIPPVPLRWSTPAAAEASSLDATPGQATASVPTTGHPVQRVTMAGEPRHAGRGSGQSWRSTPRPVSQPGPQTTGPGAPGTIQASVTGSSGGGGAVPPAPAPRMSWVDRRRARREARRQRAAFERQRNRPVGPAANEPAVNEPSGDIAGPAMVQRSASGEAGIGAPRRNQRSAPDPTNEPRGPIAVQRTGSVTPAPVASPAAVGLVNTRQGRPGAPPIRPVPSGGPATAGGAATPGRSAARPAAPAVLGPRAAPHPTPGFDSTATSTPADRPGTPVRLHPPGPPGRPLRLAQPLQRAPLRQTDASSEPEEPPTHPHSSAIPLLSSNGVTFSRSLVPQISRSAVSSSSGSGPDSAHSSPTSSTAKDGQRGKSMDEIGGAELDGLARRLLDPVVRLLRAELRHGRERFGRPHDRRR